MKKLIKKIIAYDKTYNLIKSSFLYQGYKRINGKLADSIYGNPSKDFFVIGVTGTNGKTTTANMLHFLLNKLVSPTVMISTACIKIGNETIINDKKMTSLDVFDLQEVLTKAKKKGCKIAILETSSQGLDQYRFEGVTFDYAILTNITQDHLDYHKSMFEYTKAKKMLFEYVLNNKKETKYASLPADDKVGRQWYDEMAFDKKISFGLQHSCTLKAENIKEHKTHTDFNIKYLGNNYNISCKILGKYNVYNFLAALSVGLQIGLEINECINVLSKFEGVDGRMQKIDHNGISYFVDFAHSPDALEKTLAFLKELKQKHRLILVFGAPGNRDKIKRPIMGQIADKYADILIATDDDPDTENRINIIKQLTSKITNKQKVYTIPERKLAIKFATKIAQKGDIVMLAGKGHEPIQWTNFGTRKRSDKGELLKSLKATANS